MERHKFDPLSAGFGLVFILVSVPTLVADVDVPWRLIGPLAIVVIGLTMFANVLTDNRRD